MSSNLFINEQLLCGLAHPHLIEVSQLRCQIHGIAVEPLLALRDSANASGFCLQVASSYRSFERQLHIWNSKAKGLRPVLNSEGQPLDIHAMSDDELMFAILRWSALPGSSRHHWGTDLDVYDSSVITPDYVLQLTLEETQGKGPFALFHQWLDDRLAHGQAFGFYRPYPIDLGGVAPEPWHLSYAPLAREFARQFNEDMLRRRIQNSEILLKQVILDNLTEVYQRFIRVAA